MTTTIAGVRQAIADACSTIPGWRASPYIKDTVAPPEIQVVAGQVDYDLVMARGADIWNYTLMAYVQRDSERAGQIMLDELCAPSGAGSLKTVLEADVALAALVDYVRVRTASEVRSATVGAVTYLLVEFTVEVCY